MASFGCWIPKALLSNPILHLQDLRDSGCAPKTIRWGIELVANVSRG